VLLRRWLGGPLLGHNLPNKAPQGKGEAVIVVGIILLILGFLLSIPILWTLGIIVLVIGLILMLMGSMGRAIGGRRHYY
jgi:uncharacterized membrane protein HdeD (DUF308 family)